MNNFTIRNLKKKNLSLLNETMPKQVAEQLENGIPSDKLCEVATIGVNILIIFH